MSFLDDIIGLVKNTSGMILWPVPFIGDKIGDMLQAAGKGVTSDTWGPNNDQSLWEAMGYDPNTMGNSDWQQYAYNLDPQNYINDGSLAGPNGQYAGTSYGGGNAAAVTPSSPPGTDPYATSGSTPTTPGSPALPDLGYAPGGTTAAPTMPGQVAAPFQPSGVTQLPAAVNASEYAPAQYSLPAAPQVNLQDFASILDAADFSGISIGGGGAIAPANVGGIEQRLSNQWAGMWAGVNAEIDLQEQREIQTLTEIVMTDWGDQWQHGIAALDQKGLSSPDESTTADYWQKKWTTERDQTLVQGVRDIQNAASNRRLEWTKFGMEMQSDWAKFDVSSALEARSQDITVRGQDVQAGIASAQIAAEFKKFGLQAQLDLQKLGIETATRIREQDLGFLSNQADREQRWASELYSGEVNQRGQDISFMNAQLDRDQSWATTLYDNSVTQRGQDIDWSTANQASQDRNAALQQAWASLYGDLWSKTRGQDLDYSLNQQRLQQGYDIADMEKDSADTANIWDAVGNIIPSDWFKNLWEDLWD